jgi:hypothetical protein
MAVVFILLVPDCRLVRQKQNALDEAVQVMGVGADSAVEKNSSSASVVKTSVGVEAAS